jgi:hypothetical protein
VDQLRNSLSAVSHARSRSGSALKVDEIAVPRPLDLEGDTDDEEAPVDDVLEDLDSEGVTSVDDSGFAVGAWYGQ